MAILSAEALSLHFGPRAVFEDTSLAIEPRDRLGVVGPNGAGKSTLLRVLAGRIDADGGKVVRSRGVRVGYLEQEHADPGDGGLLEVVLATAPGRDAIEERLAEVEAELAAEGDTETQLALAQELADLVAELADLDARFGPHRAQRILAGLGFAQEDHARPVRDFSGGWRMRAALAALLYQQPDVLLLDEPTNHLDMPTVAWLSSFLRTFSRAVVLTCHDREFLNRHVNRVASLELEGLKVFRGNYDAYLEQRELELEHLEARVRADERRRKHLEAFVTRFKAKASKARQAQSKAKQIEKIESQMLELPELRRPIAIRFDPVERSADEVLRVDRVHFAYPERTPLFRGLELSVRRGDRIAIVGVNGAGKSTLLRLLCHQLQPQQGEVRLGHKVSPSYFAQHQAEVMSSASSVLDEVRRGAPELSETRARTLCGAFLFSGDDVDKSVGVLSGGEKTRVALARMLAAPGNLLLLDEPTNHLDTESADKLTESLLSFDGTILFVSHDLDFARRLSNKVWDVRAGEVEVYAGSLGDYLLELEARAAALEAEGGATDAAVSAAPPSDKEARKAARQQERKLRAELQRRAAKIEAELAGLEADIASAEAELATVEAKLADPASQSDFTALEKLGRQHAALKARIDRDLERWTELGESAAEARAEVDALQA
jgi:ATP-binding cassette subfamily F protein 3